MKIKTVKKMNLPELIQYVWDEQIKSSYGATHYHSNLNTVVEVDMSGQVSVHGQHYGIEVYTVPAMEELTEETEIHGAAFVYYDELKQVINTHKYEDASPRKLKHIIRPSLYPEPLAVFKGKQLIWTIEHGIPADGVLEVDNDENQD